MSFIQFLVFVTGNIEIEYVGKVFIISGKLIQCVLFNKELTNIVNKHNIKSSKFDEPILLLQIVICKSVIQSVPRIN